MQEIISLNKIAKYSKFGHWVRSCCYLPKYERDRIVAVGNTGTILVASSRNLEESAVFKPDSGNVHQVIAFDEHFVLCQENLGVNAYSVTKLRRTKTFTCLETLTRSRNEIIQMLRWDDDQILVLARGGNLAFISFSKNEITKSLKKAKIIGSPYIKHLVRSKKYTNSFYTNYCKKFQKDDHNQLTWKFRALSRSGGMDNRTRRVEDINKPLVLFNVDQNTEIRVFAGHTRDIYSMEIYQNSRREEILLAGGTSSVDNAFIYFFLTQEEIPLERRLFRKVNVGTTIHALRTVRDRYLMCSRNDGKLRFYDLNQACSGKDIEQKWKFVEGNIHDSWTYEIQLCEVSTTSCICISAGGDKSCALFKVEGLELPNNEFVHQDMVERLEFLTFELENCYGSSGEMEEATICLVGEGVSLNLFRTWLLM